jgi:hypothetical protein
MTRLAKAMGAILLFVSSAAHADEPVDYEALYANPTAQAAFIKEKIKEHFPRDYPVMIAIASCESTGLIHWTEEGSLLPQSEGKSSAAGVFQVLLNGHEDAIAKHRLDMHDVDDYLTFVKILVDGRPNYADWNASRDCWSPRIASN